MQDWKEVGSHLHRSLRWVFSARDLFGDDQAKNGRLRDIAISPDGLRLYLVNTGGANADKIIEYAWTGPLAVDVPAGEALWTGDLDPGMYLLRAEGEGPEVATVRFVKR